MIQLYTKEYHFLETKNQLHQLTASPVKAYLRLMPTTLKHHREIHPQLRLLGWLLFAIWIRAEIAC